MSSQLTHATPQDDPGQHAADAHQHRQALRDLIAIGTGFAHLLHAQAIAQAAQAPAQQAASTPPTPASPTPTQPQGTPAAPTLATLAAAFDQVARAVRRCILLAQHLANPKQPASTPTQHRTAARKQIIRAVEDLIQRPSDDTGHDPDAANALRAELHDRLDAPDLDDDIATRPVAEVIKEITRDLGLDAMPGTRPFQRRTPADIARLNARAAAPTSPRQATPGPQVPGPVAAQRPPNPGRDEQGSAGPTATSRPLAPVHASNKPPDDTAEAIAFVLHHGTRAAARCRPPPGT